MSGDAPRRAGSSAGEGRARPGRPVEPGAEVPSTAPAASAGPPQRATAVPVPPAPPEQPVRQAGGGAEPVLRILPLGSGLVLIGLGLGLAFVGLRVRRGAG
ncbi:hypothetical protein [Streptomyces sp. B93]|uniref:hypothetical protein n=1 Tax=Streptomyces sp. B93 TaxID=2824875 RepID=UPI001B3647D5|nr:hypothetical protein [Streptomyces sp. B93]MBQ1090959.1 hypothetical protein [Streptomyces sp. B93]